ncbi:MAG: succinate dehydrogenase, cytochrome b556 subunit [Xanthomonadales bacterium]|jgi:succinate dehydrogenase / fumarate reductase cytochrome b subunit|nr:succinate dehydrogenase, cytochrome b556 subunit [Xanthomonadales bacterium]MDH3939773.1 succinate dehydrogenase, cytochrome b556 subunit [Xanthomonadales bacterium]MDH4000132.1 succinate dehydrogenase, cytochrome b556 subunit [Xanthomonadales bacterium]
MKQKQRPLSPFMIGPYYKPQLTSLMSITHRATGVFLSVVGAPLLLWWLIAVSSGPDAYMAMQTSLGGWLGSLVIIASVFCLSFHFLNGIRHLVWDTGTALEIEKAYALGWVVLAGSLVLTILLSGALL